MCQNKNGIKYLSQCTEVLAKMYTWYSVIQ
jgi:hypothetical protein